MMGKQKNPNLSRILRGDLDDLPVLDSNKIRVFLSSTFTDMAAERNYLTAHTFPKLQLYCSQIGMEFEVVDMRWGVKDEAADDHMTSELVISEIKQSQEQSKGPNFVNLLGNRYGSRFTPRKIDAEEVETLLQTGVRHKKDTTVIREWYRKDENAIPAEYILQRISSKLVYYNDNDPYHAEQRQKDQTEWKNISSYLELTLRDLADIAYKEGRLSHAQREKYFISVTEDEVRVGLLEVENAAEKALVFLREIKDIRLKDKIAWRYIDLDDSNKLNKESQNLMMELKREKIPLKLPAENITESTVPWNKNGVTMDHIKHVKYLDNFSKVFTEKITAKINDCRGSVTDDMESQLVQEVLHHSHFCLKKCKIFEGREEALKIVKKKLLQVDDCVVDEVNQKVTFIDDTNSRQTEDKTVNSEFTLPLVVYGDTGTGKTAFLAKVVNEAPDWIPNCIRLVRFLGTSAWSTCMKDVFRTMSMQLWQIGKFEADPKPQTFSNVISCGQFFLSLLEKVASKDSPVLIVIDGVDQLDMQSEQWVFNIFDRLPPNAYLIASTISHPMIVHSFQEMLPSDRLMELLPLNPDEGMAVVLATLQSVNRRLTDEQINYTRKYRTGHTIPLFLKVALRDASVFTSYFDPRNEPQADSVEELIDHFFQRLERDNGRIIIERALGYLTISKGGIADHEMLDLLSLDDEVLQDTYLWHLPANNNIRIPTSIWRRAHMELEEYLTIRQTDRKQLVTWYYCQFKGVSTRKYLTADTRPILHKHLVEYFTGEFSSKSKPIEFYKVKKGSYPDANRQVPEQPLMFGTCMPNLRKMSELPYHLVKAGCFEEFVDIVACSFEWLYQKTKYTSVNDVLGDLAMALDEMNKCGNIDSTIYEEITEIQNLNLSLSDVFRADPNQIGPAIIGSLDKSCKKFPRIWKMLQQAKEWCKNTDISLLVPRNLVFPQTRGVLVMSMHVNMRAGDSIDLSDSMVVLKERMLSVIEDDGTTINMYNIQGYGEIAGSNKMNGKMKSIKEIADKYVLIDFFEEGNIGRTYKELYTLSLVKKIEVEEETDLVVSPQGKYVAMFYRERGQANHIGMKKRSTGFKVMTLSTKVTHHIPAEDSPIDGIFTPNENQLLTITQKGSISIWNVEGSNFVLQGVLPGSTALDNGMVTWVALDSHLLVSWEKDVLSVFNLETGLLEYTLQHNEQLKINLLAVDAAQKVVATASKVWTMGDRVQRSVRVWDARAGQLLSVCKDVGSCTALNFCGDKDEFLIIASIGKPVGVWYIGSFDKPHPEAVLVRCLHEQPTHQLDMLLCGNHLFIAGGDDCINCFALDALLREAEGNLKQPALIKMMEPPFSIDIVLAITLKVVLTSSSDGCLRFFDIDDGTLIDTIKAHETSVVHTILTSDEQFCITCANNESVKVWNIHERNLHTSLQVPGAQTQKTQCLAEAGGIVAVGCSDEETSTLNVWRLDTGDLLHDHMLGNGCGMPKVALTSRGGKIITAGASQLSVFDTKTGACQEVTDPLSPQTQEDLEDVKKIFCTQILVAPDDKIAAVGFMDGSVHVITTNALLIRKIQLSTMVPKFSFLKDCSHIIISDRENIGVWTPQGELKVTFKRHNDHVTNFELRCQDSFLVTSSNDHSILIWDLQSARTLARFITHAPVKKMAVSPNLDSIYFIPDRANHLGILKPNPALMKTLNGADHEVSDKMKLAQALAFGFSSTKTKVKTSQTCIVL